VLLLTGQQSIFNNTTKALHLAILKAVADRTKVEFVEVGEVANVLEEKVCYIVCTGDSLHLFYLFPLLLSLRLFVLCHRIWLYLTFSTTHLKLNGRPIDLHVYVKETGETVR